MTPISVQSLSAAVFLAISSYAPMVNSGYRVEHGAPLNEDPERTPWVGVWPGDMELEPKTVGQGAPFGFAGTVEINVFHQWNSWQGSGDALIGLMCGQDAILTIVGSSIPMQGFALALVGIRTGLFAASPTDEAFFTNQITLRYMVQG